MVNSGRHLERAEQDEGDDSRGVSPIVGHRDAKSKASRIVGDLKRRGALARAAQVSSSTTMSWYSDVSNVGSRNCDGCGHRFGAVGADGGETEGA